MAAGVILSLFVFALAPESLAVLELEVAPRVAARELKDGLYRAAVDELVALPERGESPDHQAALFGCDAAEAACLGQVAAALGVRYLVYGRAEPAASGGVALSLSLFDGASGEGASAAYPLASAEDRAGMRAALRQLLAARPELLRPLPAPPEEPRRRARFLTPALLALGSVGLGGAVIALKGSDQRFLEAPFATGLAIASDVCIVAAGVSLAAALLGRRGAP